MSFVRSVTMRFISKVALPLTAGSEAQAQCLAAALLLTAISEAQTHLLRPSPFNQAFAQIAAFFFRLFTVLLESPMEAVNYLFWPAPRRNQMLSV